MLWELWDNLSVYICWLLIRVFALWLLGLQHSILSEVWHGIIYNTLLVFNVLATTSTTTRILGLGHIIPSSVPEYQQVIIRLTY
jgi:hypothetical protein